LRLKAALGDPQSIHLPIGEGGAGVPRAIQEWATIQAVPVGTGRRQTEILLLDTQWPDRYTGAFVTGPSRTTP